MFSLASDCCGNPTPPSLSSSKGARERGLSCSILTSLHFSQCHSNTLQSIIRPPEIQCCARVFRRGCRSAHTPLTGLFGPSELLCLCSDVLILKNSSPKMIILSSFACSLIAPSFRMVIYTNKDKDIVYKTSILKPFHRFMDQHLKDAMFQVFSGRFKSQ